MNNLMISTAQFENKSGDKDYNLNIIEKLSKKASLQGSKVISFHECSITGYTFARHLSKKQMLDLAEYIPSGKSIKRLVQIARKYNIAILAGLFEKDKKINYTKLTSVSTNTVCLPNTGNFTPL